MKPNLLALILFVFLVVIPMYYINKLLLSTIQPRRSFGRFLLYMVSVLALAFVYTVIFAWLLLKLVYVQPQ